jgi:hypothetical protein
MMNESGSNGNGKSNIESATDFDNESIAVADADAVSAELVMGNSEGGFHDDDISDSDDVKAIKGEEGGDDDTDESDGDRTSGTYPADCYSFLALHSPFDHFGFW